MNIELELLYSQNRKITNILRREKNVNANGESIIESEIMRINNRCQISTEM